MGVVLIRHGAIESPGIGKYCIGQKEYHLSSQGKEQIKCLGRDSKAPNMIFSSSSKRCVQTSEILRKAWDCPVLYLEELKEINMGIWDGLAFAKIRQDYPQEYEERGKNLATYRVCGGESFEEVQKRAQKAMGQILARNEEDIAVVTHAGVIRALLCKMDDKPLAKMFTYDIPLGASIAVSAEQTQKLKA